MNALCSQCTQKFIGFKKYSNSVVICKSCQIKNLEAKSLKRKLDDDYSEPESEVCHDCEEHHGDGPDDWHMHCVHCCLNDYFNLKDKETLDGWVALEDRKEERVRRGLCSACNKLMQQQKARDTVKRETARIGTALNKLMDLDTTKQDPLVQELMTACQTALIAITADTRFEE